MFLALRDIRFAKGRFALMGVVVALITLLLVMLSGLTAGLGNQSTSALKDLGTTDSATGAITPVDRIAFGAASGNEAKASFTESQVTAEQADSWRSAPGVTAVEPLGISQTRFQGGAAGTGTSTGTTNVAVFGIPEGSGLSPVAVRLGEAVIGASVAEDLSLKAGDPVNIGGRDLVLRAIVDDQWYSHTTVVYTSLKDWKELAHLSDPDQVGTVLAVTGAPTDAGAADTAAGTVSTTRTGSFAALGSYQSENGSLMMMQGFLYGISALVIVAFLTVWTVQRTRDIAVLKAMGASDSYVVRDAITQAAVVLLAGAGIGGAIGLAGGLLAEKFAPFMVTPATTLVPIAGILLLGLAGAVLAVSRVTKVDALIALGGN